MTTLAEYFSANRQPAKYHMGDRVRGFFDGIPFSGTVAADTVVYEHLGPMVRVFLDLPIIRDHGIHNIIMVGYEDILKAKESYGLKSKTNRKKSIVDSN